MLSFTGNVVKPKAAKQYLIEYHDPCFLVAIKLINIYHIIHLVILTSYWENQTCFLVATLLGLFQRVAAPVLDPPKRCIAFGDPTIPGSIFKSSSKCNTGGNNNHIVDFLVPSNSIIWNLLLLIRSCLQKLYINSNYFKVQYMKFWCSCWGKP